MHFRRLPFHTPPPHSIVRWFFALRWFFTTFSLHFAMPSLLPRLIRCRFFVAFQHSDTRCFRQARRHAAAASRHYFRRCRWFHASEHCASFSSPPDKVHAIFADSHISPLLLLFPRAAWWALGWADTPALISTLLIDNLSSSWPRWFSLFLQLFSFSSTDIFMFADAFTFSSPFHYRAIFDTLIAISRRRPLFSDFSLSFRRYFSMLIRRRRRDAAGCFHSRPMIVSPAADID